MNSKPRSQQIHPSPIKLKPAGPSSNSKSSDLQSSSSSFKSNQAPQSPLRILSKPNDNKSEIISEILKRRNIFEESYTRLTKSYSQQEKEMFKQISNPEEIKLLEATRPALLSIPLKPEQVQLTPTKLQSKPGHRRLLSKGSKDLSDSSSTHSNNSTRKLLDEDLIRQKLEIEFNQKKNILINQLEHTFNVNLEEDKEIIEEYWKNIIAKLQQQLDDAQVVTEESEQDLDKLEFIKEMEAEIEEKIKKEFKSRSKYKKPIPKREKENLILSLQAHIEVEQIQILQQEKQIWNKTSLAEVQEECKERIWLEHEDLLLRKEIEMRRQAEYELQEIISSLKKETEAAIAQKSKKIIKEQESINQEIEERVIFEAQQELIDEEILNFKSKLIQKIQIPLYNELKSAIFPQIEIELKLRMEENICNELSLSFNTNFESFKKKLEKSFNEKIIELECKLEADRACCCKKLADEKFVRVQKDLKIGFLKKLDRLKGELRKEFERDYGCRERMLREKVIKEKSETCQIRAQVNVIVNQINLEKQALIKQMITQEDQFNRVRREASVRKTYEPDQSQIKSSPEHSISPKKFSSLAIDEELNQILPRPLPPPTISEYSSHPSPKRKLLKHYDTKEIVNEIIMKNSENFGKSQNGFYRVLETPVRPKSTIPFFQENMSTEKSIKRNETPTKKPSYYDLLHKKYGVMEPRNKK